MLKKMTFNYYKKNTNPEDLNNQIDYSNFIKCTECDLIFHNVESMTLHFYKIHEKAKVDEKKVEEILIKINDSLGGVENKGIKEQNKENNQKIINIIKEMKDNYGINKKSNDILKEEEENKRKVILKNEEELKRQEELRIQLELRNQEELKRQIKQKREEEEELRKQKEIRKREETRKQEEFKSRKN